MIKQQVKNSVLWAYWYPLRSVVDTLSPSTMYRLASLFGDLHRNVSQKKQQSLCNEYQFLAKQRSPGDSLATAVRMSFVHHFQNDFEMFRYKDMTAETIDQYIVCNGLKHLDNALAENKGVILTLGHFGANKMIMAALGHRGYPMNQLSTPSTVWIEKRVDRDMRGMSRRDLELRWQADCQLPSKLINIFGPIRPAYRCLKNGEILGVAIDGPGGKRKIELEWNGHRTIFSLGPMDLAVRTGASVLPVYVIREPSGKNIMIIEEKVNSDSSQSPEELTRIVVKQHAAQALKHPSFYLEFMAMRRLMNTIDGTGLFVEERGKTWQKSF